MRASISPSFALVIFFCLVGGIAVRADEMDFTSFPAKSSLVELYTSEGCSSCPPAEAWLNDLKNSPLLWKQIYPVSFHVDYWDGLGWPDRFARPAYTQRQRDYASRLGQDSVYTPEFVVDGSEFRGWFHGQPTPAATDKSGELKLGVRDEQISATYAPAAQASSRNLTLNLALLGVNLITDVKGGENGGRQLKHDFVVLGFASVPLKPGSDGILHSESQRLKSSDPSSALVGWISDANGTILQIAGGWTAK